MKYDYQKLIEMRDQARRNSDKERLELINAVVNEVNQIAIAKSPAVDRLNPPVEIVVQAVKKQLKMYTEMAVYKPEAQLKVDWLTDMLPERLQDDELFNASYQAYTEVSLNNPYPNKPLNVAVFLTAKQNLEGQDYDVGLLKQIVDNVVKAKQSRLISKVD